MSAESRRRAERAGRMAETVAAIWLRLKGYRILARRLKTPVGEIDILAARGASLVAVEVKSRASRIAALESIAPRQWHRLARAVEWAQAHRPEWVGLSLRFDAVLLVPGRLPHHVADAWRPDWSSLS